MIHTTLNAIRDKQPCADGWAKLLKYLGKTAPDDEPLPLRTILDSNGFDDALWTLRCVTGHDREVRLYAVWCARQVQHLMTDPRSVAALAVAERFANGDATQDELAAARDAARDAAIDAAGDAARAAAEAAVWAAAWATAWATAMDAAEAAARAAAWDAAWDAAEAAAGYAARAAAGYAAGDAAADAVRAAAWAAAWDAAWDAAADAQKTKFTEMIEAAK